MLKQRCYLFSYMVNVCCVSKMYYAPLIRLLGQQLHITWMVLAATAARGHGATLQNSTAVVMGTCDY